MINLGAELSAVGEHERAHSFELFSRTLDMTWIRSALALTGSATVRRRKLPAEFVVWLIIGMALLRDRSIDEVVRHLDLVLPTRTASGLPTEASRSAVVQARTRLGSSPLETLFHETGALWSANSADALRWRGLAVYGVDGTTLRIPDTEENEIEFGRPHGPRGLGAYPQLRLVALMVLRSHLLADLVVGPYHTGEQTLAQTLWERLPDHSVIIVDKGFINYSVFHHIENKGTGRHWLLRAKSNLKWTIVRPLGQNDLLVELPVNHVARKKHPELPQKILARAICYQRRGFRPQTLLTSLLDPELYPAAEIVELYHERWELEIGFDEVKTHTLERAEALRSKAPERILQELWGLAIAYNLVRLEIEHVANRLQLPPRRISYRHALMLVRNFLVSAWLASPGVLPARLQALHEELTLLVLPERRPRQYPRVVKIKMSHYPKKPPPKRCLKNTRRA
jgi:hypothetical protein